MSPRPADPGSSGECIDAIKSAFMFRLKSLPHAVMTP
jgi:hypothetical protein